MPDVLPSTIISRVPGLLATEVDGETVLMHVEQGQYFGLARTAHVIWELLVTPQSFAQLCQALTTRFSGPPGAIEADTRRFVQKMAEEKLVSID